MASMHFMVRALEGGNDAGRLFAAQSQIPITVVTRPQAFFARSKSVRLATNTKLIPTMVKS